MNAGMIRPHTNSLALIFRVIDLLIIVGALFYTALLFRIQLDVHLFNVGLLSVVSFWSVAELNRLYRSWRSIRFVNQVFTVSVVWLICVLIMVSIAYFFRAADMFQRDASAFWFALVAIALVVWRFVYRRALYILRSNDYNTRKALIIGVNGSAKALADEFKYNPRHGIRLVGFFDDRSVERLETDLPIAGRVEDALNMARSAEVDNVYIALPMNAEQRTQDFLERLSDTTANVYLIPNFFVYNLLYSRWQEVGNVLTLSVYDSPHLNVNGWLKRMEDIVLSSLLIVMLAIPMLLIAIAIKTTSHGPVIFKQYRYGLDGKEFKVFKFRSMTTEDNGPVVRQATQNDSRVTPLGKFLRKSSLDELPQIFNVFGGTMSLVGPRPHAVAHNEEYRKLIKGYMLRHKVRPGITGWAQINGFRGETDTIEKMKGRIEYDLDYIHKWSLLLDFKIMFLTIYRTRRMAVNAY